MPVASPLVGPPAPPGFYPGGPLPVPARGPLPAGVFATQQANNNGDLPPPPPVAPPPGYSVAAVRGEAGHPPQFNPPFGPQQGYAQGYQGYNPNGQDVPPPPPGNLF